MRQTIRSTAAELAPLVTTPARDRAIRDHRARRGSSGVDVLDAEKPPNVTQRPIVFRVASSELSLVVATPTANLAVAENGARVVVPERRLPYRSE
jgi:hypothetical protein